MTRRYFFRLVLCLFASVSFVRAAESAAQANSHHSLWRIEGRSNVVYLLGSVHLLKPSDYPLASVIESAFTNSSLVIFETDIAKMAEPQIHLKMMSKAALPAGETLKDNLSQEVYADYLKKLEQVGLPSSVFENLKPSMAALALVVMEFQRLGADPNFGVDQHFFKRARKDGKRIVPLETVEFQIDLVTDFTKEEGEAMMKSLLEQIDQTRKMYSEMVLAWKTGDSAGLEKLLNDAMSDSPALYKRFLTDRNRRWVPKIQELLQGGENAIVIVGAGHLVGADSVVQLLEKSGAKIKQM